MKKSIITIVLCLMLFSQLGYSQPNYRQAASDSTSNFYTIKADFETWLDTVQLSDSLKQRELKKFGRWASFWYPRVQCEDSQLRGLFSTYQNFLGISWINPSCTGIDDAKWENVGPYPNDLQDMGFVQAIWFEKENPDTILVGSSRTGGIIKSVDRGKTWYDVLSPTRIPAYGISSFAVSPARNPNNGKRVIYASTGSDKVGYSLGILKSVDGGETWSILEDFPPYYHRQFHIMVKKIVVYHYNGNDYLYAIANNRILTSANGGLNWTDLVTITGVNGYIFNDIEICPNNNNIFVISGFPLEPQSQDPPLRAKMWITYNGGSNFSEILGNSGYNLVNQVSNVLLSFPASSNLYIHTASPTERKIILFEPSTSSWTIYNPNYKTGIGGQFNMFEVPGNCSYFYIGTETFSISSTTAKGSELIPYGIYTHTHPDIRCMDFLDDILMLGSDGGVIYSDDHGNTWQSINGFGKDGLTNNEVMGMDITDTYEPEIIAGLFDNNFKHYHDQEWYSAIPTDVTYIQSNGPYFIQSDIGIGDIAQIAINEANHNEILMHSNYGLNYVTRNSNTYSALNDLTTSWHAVGHWWNSALERSKTNPDQVIRGGWEGKVYLSDDGGLTFSDPGIQLPGCTADVTRIKIAPSNPQIIYAMSIQNIGNNYTGYVLYRSDDGGNNWTDITGGANLQTSIQNQWYSATDFTIDWHDPNRVWVCMGGLPTQYPSGVPITKERVFTTYDASQGANTQWYDITGNSSSGLPPLPTSAIVNQPGTSRVFLATDGGIFYRDDNDPDWICFSNGFPITHVTDMKINRKTNEIFASTYGYGIFKSPLPCGSESLTPTEIDASSGDVTWSNVSKSLGDVYVRSGYTLTIDNNSVITMIPNSKIVVERGAKLVVDNATLTSCEEMWDGIIVYGNVFQPQAGNIQGKVELLNGATIANARAGVATGSARSAGGIIQADKAKFFNCEYAVKMHPYKNFNPNNPSQKLPESSFLRTVNLLPPAN